MGMWDIGPFNGDGGFSRLHGVGPLPDAQPAQPEADMTTTAGTLGAAALVSEISEPVVD